MQTVLDTVNRLGLAGYESIPDHSLLEWIISTEVSYEVDNVERVRDRQKAPRKFNYGQIRNDLFSDERIKRLLENTISNLENSLNRRREIDAAYAEF